MTSTDLYQAFQNPFPQYRLVPFWTWNGEMKPDIMLEQLRSMQGAGISEFVILPFWPLRIPYCEGVWWDRIELALEFCEANDMKVWIYDEYSWPSGACGGKLLRDKPSARSTVMGYLSVHLEPGEIATETIDGTLLSACLLKPDGSVIDATDLLRFPEPQRIEWQNNSDIPLDLYLFIRNVTDELLNFSVGAPWSDMQRGYLNTLDPEAVQSFVESTYEQYARRFGRHFGKTIRGFFTDEPALAYYGTTYGNTSLPYADRLFQAFLERYKYDLAPRVIELLHDVGDYQKTRHDYWSMVTSLFTDSYHRTLRKWCDEHNLLLMGHPVWEEALGWNIIFSGDIYEGNKWYHAPGFDLLQTNTSFDREFMENSIHIGIAPRALAVTAKIEDSTARHAGAHRTICEAYGVSPWSLTLEDQRKATDWITALGTNLIVDCMLPYCSHGFARTRLCGKNFYNPWWKYYSLFNLYAARMCAISHLCKLDAEIGIVFPMGNSYCLFNEHLKKDGFVLQDSNRHTPWGIMQESLYFAADALLKKQWDYEFIFDGIFADATIEGGRFITPNAVYSALILPGMTSLTTSQADLLESFAKDGGNLIFLAAVPSHSIDGKRDVSMIMENLQGFDNVHFLPHSAILSDDARALDNLMANILDKKVLIDGESPESILKAHRKFQDRDVITLANQSDRPVRAEISLNLQGPFEIWDPLTAETYQPDPADENRQCFTYPFAPHESIILVSIRHGDSHGPTRPLLGKSWHLQKILQEESLGDPWEFSLEGDNMFLPDWMIHTNPEADGNPLAQHARDENAGWINSKWSEADVCLDPEKLSHYWLKTSIILDSIPESLGMIVDIGSEYPVVYVNGRETGCSTSCTLWDPENARFDLLPLIRPGENNILVKVHIPDWHSSRKTVYLVDYMDINPPVLVGSFLLGDNEAIRALERPWACMKVASSWHQQGYRNFAGTAIYRKSFTAHKPDGEEQVWLDMGQVADIAEVWLNGEYVATCLFPPYEANLTRRIVTGQNILEIKVTNNFGNLIFGMWTGRRRRFTPAGLLSTPRIVRSGRPSQ